jgi:hypothetical protein
MPMTQHVEELGSKLSELEERRLNAERELATVRDSRARVEELSWTGTPCLSPSRARYPRA